MSNVQIVECPRDAMQGWHKNISTEKKVEYINSLLQVGFDTIDFGSFVSPKAIPQMADTKDVLAKLHLENTSSALLAIVANKRGAEEAVQYDAISYLGFPFSVSETFQRKNTNSTIEQSANTVDAVQELCIKHGKTLVIYLSMGFGNPYGDDYNEEILLHWSNEMVKKDISIISLADTVGLATPGRISFALNALIPAHKKVRFGVHLHSASYDLKEKIDAAYHAGCTRFDGALKGIGGCPMAQNDLVGNIPTEFLISYFDKELKLDINKSALNKSLQIANEIFS